MHDFRLPALITLATGVLHFALAWNVGRARAKYGIRAPAIAGNADFERVFRVHMNTIEGTIMFLPALWVYAAFVSETWSAALGAVWVAARVWYAIAYQQNAAKRGPAFGASTFVFVVLTAGAAWGVVKSFL
jgi:glutathione S-transferase